MYHYQAQAVVPGFPQTVSHAVGQLKQKLQCDYEQAYPALREIIHLVLDEEESKARELSAFPHLLLPDLVAAPVARLNLRPTAMKHREIPAPHFDITSSLQPACA